MEEFISRDALRSKATYMYGFGENKYVPLRAIEEAPAAKVQPVVDAEWEYDGMEGTPENAKMRNYCTNCNRVVPDAEAQGFLFCPYCGATIGRRESECKHEFVYDELHRQAVCEKCGYVATAEDKKAALAYGLSLAEQEDQR